MGAACCVTTDKTPVDYAAVTHGTDDNTLFVAEPSSIGSEMAENPQAVDTMPVISAVSKEDATNAAPRGYHSTASSSAKSTKSLRFQDPSTSLPEEVMEKEEKAKPEQAKPAQAAPAPAQAAPAPAQAASVPAQTAPRFERVKPGSNPTAAPQGNPLEADTMQTLASVSRTPGSMFKVQVDKPALTNLGSDSMDLLDGGNPLVGRLLDRLFMAWNVENPDKAISSLDRIIDVNGVTDTLGIVEKMKSSESESLSITLQRCKAERRVVVQKKQGQSLGLDVEYVTSSKIILIKSLKAGAIVDWNDAKKGPPIQVKDRIVEVNGVRGTALGLHDQLKESQVIDMTIMPYQP